MKAIVCLLLIFACAPALSAKEKEVFIHPWVTPKEKGAPWIGYQSAESALKQIDEAAARDPKFAMSSEKMRASIMPGGEFSINVQEKSEAAANTKNITVQITDENGKEIIRKTGPDEKPYRDGTNEPWQNNMLVSVPKKWTGTITLKVWNALTREMWTYTVKEPAELEASIPAS